jgi:N-acetylated-alpha-linked acidic dipeptidase
MQMVSTKNQWAMFFLVISVSIGLGDVSFQAWPQSAAAEMRGFSAEQAREESAWEQKMRALPQPDLLRAYQAELASAPHNVGSPKDKANAEWLLEKFLHEVARDVTDPVRHESVYDALQAHRIQQAPNEAAMMEISSRADLRLGALGSGSDYTAFIDHLGIASLNLGFGGEGGGGVYHSIYDSVTWFRRFSDSNFTYGQVLAQLDGTAVMRLADATVLPFEFTDLAETVGKYVAELRALPGNERKVDLTPLQTGQQSLLRSARAYEDAYAKARSLGAVFQRDPAQLRALNQLLRNCERLLTASEGLPGRPWFKHQLYAPGLYTGYGVKTIPYVREGIEQGRLQEATKGVEVVKQRLLALASQLDAATKLLR